MSEFDGQAPARSETVSDAPAQQSGGALLRQAREAAGLHIAALAVALKVPVKKLEALEADRLDLLPDAVFVRALASSVCRTLKIDSTEILALLPQTGKPRLYPAQASINTPFRSPSDGPGPSVWTNLSRPPMLAGLVLVLAALVLVFLPAVQKNNEASPAAPGPASAVSAPQPVLPTTDVPVAAPDSLPSAAADMAPAATTQAALPAAAPAALPEAPTAPVAAPAPAPLAAAATLPVNRPPAAASGTIVFTAKGESWVEVTDAKGVVVLRRTLAAGESAGASGALPLAAVVGRVDATLVQVRGRPFDLLAVSRDNVARFEVK